MRIALPLLLLPALLAACTRDTTAYPSLAKRPVEAMDFADPPAAPVQAAAADPALDARIAGLTTRLRAVATGFDGDATKAERRARASGARTVGSDAWLDAQTALAALDDWRAQTTAIATDIESAASERAATLAPPYPGLGTLEQAAAAELARQDGVLSRLQAALPG